MKSIWTKLFTATVLAVAFLAFAPNRAEAGVVTGFACLVDYNPSVLSSTYGTKGYVYVTVTSGMSCTGSFLGWGRFMTLGATYHSVNPNYVYSEIGIHSVYRSLSDALINGVRIWINYSNSGAVFDSLRLKAN